LKCIIEKLDVADSNEKVREIFENNEASDMLYITGFKKATQKLTFEDRATLKSVLIDYHCIVKVKAEMDQFIEGIATTDVLRLMRHSPAKFKCLFVPSLNIITASKKHLC
jgi:hypothetical protein